MNWLSTIGWDGINSLFGAYALTILIPGLPFVVGLTTESFMLILELQPKTGAVNFVMQKLGLTDGSTAWLVHTNLAIAALCVLVVWSASGLTMVLLMAGMQGIPRDLYESADVDGASWWTKELTITLPLLRRTIALSLILSVIGSKAEKVA